MNNDTEDIVGVICIDRKGKVLLVQGNGGKWSFPKGRRKEGETKYQAALRESKEEAGIDLQGRPVNAKITLRYGAYYLYTFGRTGEEIPLEAPMTPEEITKVQWISTNSVEFATEEKNADLRVYLSKT